VIEAVTPVAVGVPVIVPLTPVLADTTPAAPARLVPAKLTLNVVPTVPEGGVIDISVVVAALTVNGKVKFVAPTLRPKVVAPVVAVPVIVIKALTLVLVGAPVIEPLTPGLVDTTPVAPARLVPVKLTLNEVPAVPEDGVIDVSVGAAELTVKLTE